MYWLVVITEGTYLGAGFVALLYDWSAKRYDDIKKAQFIDEAYYVGVPLIERLGERTSPPMILDLATGTGRVALALTRQWQYDCRVIGLDRARKMLVEAKAAVDEIGPTFTLAQAGGRALPVASNSMDAVTCLEALEFMPAGDQALAEIVRVCKPGGLLMLSNRVGWESRFFWGRIARRGTLEAKLEALGCTAIDSRRWQVHYDLIWATAPGGERGAPAPHGDA